MKLLEVQTFAPINSLLQIESTDCHVSGRVEAFSCKMISSDKKLFGEMESRSPDPVVLSVSPMGYSKINADTKTLSYFVSTLNLSFPDYDFGGVDWKQFHRVTLEMAKTTVNETLQEVMANADKMKEEFEHRLATDEFWVIINDQIDLANCEIYSYIPEPDSDPFQTEGYIWSFNYFFFNSRIHQLVFLTCSAVSTIHTPAMRGFGLTGDDEFDLMDEGVFPQGYEDEMEDVQ